DAVQDQITDLVVVQGPGEDALGGVAESPAAVTAGLILAAGDLQIGDGLVGDGADGARRQFPFANAVAATPGARGLLGCAVNGYIDDRGCLGAHACVFRGEGDQSSFTGTQALSFKSKTACRRKISRWC